MSRSRREDWLRVGSKQNPQRFFGSFFFRPPNRPRNRSMKEPTWNWALLGTPMNGSKHHQDNKIANIHESTTIFFKKKAPKRGERKTRSASPAIRDDTAIVLRGARRAKWKIPKKKQKKKQNKTPTVAERAQNSVWTAMDEKINEQRKKRRVGRRKRGRRERERE